MTKRCNTNKVYMLMSRDNHHCIDDIDMLQVWSIPSIFHSRRILGGKTAITGTIQPRGICCSSTSPERL